MRYVYTFTQPRKLLISGELEHDYNDGAVVLTASVLAHMLKRHPRLWKGKGRRNRVECGACHEIIESIYQHDYRVCSCGKTMVDGGQGNAYVRWGGAALRAPDETRLERKIIRLAKVGVRIVAFKNGMFKLRWDEDPHGGSKRKLLQGRSLSALLDEAIKRQFSDAD